MRDDFSPQLVLFLFLLLGLFFCELSINSRKCLRPVWHKYPLIFGFLLLFFLLKRILAKYAKRKKWDSSYSNTISPNVEQCFFTRPFSEQCGKPLCQAAPSHQAFRYLFLGISISLDAEWHLHTKLFNAFSRILKSPDSQSTPPHLAFRFGVNGYPIIIPSPLRLIDKHEH